MILALLLILPVATWADCAHEYDVTDGEANLMVTDEDTLGEIELERLGQFRDRVATCIFGERITPPLRPTGDLPLGAVDPSKWINEDYVDLFAL